MTSASALPRRDIAIGAWLALIATLVVAMILVGGATRLTDSGLSITEWDLEKGLTPPLSGERWAEEFALYQRTTEYKHQNAGMSLGEFQAIYWWEWGHRFLGKMLGLAFALPFAFFWAAGRLRGRFWPVLGLFALGGAQGGVGWWMVTSGLFERLDVSPLRLAIHLGLALIILALALWLAMDAFGSARARVKAGAPNWAPVALMALVFAQAMAGALLAGAKGGPAYADWPTIGGEWIPAHAFALEPFWRNFTENHAAQHLLHRSLGYLTAFAAIGLGAMVWLRGQGAGRWAGLSLATIAALQAGLGIATVAAGSPVWLSLTHQAGAVLLWISAGVLVYCAGTALPSYQITDNMKKNAPS